MNNKPEMYRNKITKSFNNNKEVYASYNKISDVSNWNTTDIRKQIDEIVNSSFFIYSKMVNIMIGNDIIKRKIIGVFNNNLLTTLNESIPIENIRDIYI